MGGWRFSLKVKKTKKLTPTFFLGSLTQPNAWLKFSFKSFEFDSSKQGQLFEQKLLGLN